MANEILSQAELSARLHYDPETGLFRWKTSSSNRIKVGGIAGTAHNAGYVSICINSRLYLAHRLAFLYLEGVLPSDEIDHINGVRNDNRWANLRHATHAQNLKNTSTFSHNTSGMRGVYRRKDTGRWQAQIKLGGKNIALGCFDTSEEASRVREITAQRLFGDFYRVTGRETSALTKG